MRSFHDYKKLHPTQIRDYKMKYIFTIVLAYVLGHWGWPFAAYMLSCDIGILVYIIAATSVLISIIFFSGIFYKRLKSQSCLVGFNGISWFCM